MDSLKFHLKLNLEIKELKNIVIKFKKIKIIKSKILSGIIFQIHLENQNSS